METYTKEAVAWILQFLAGQIGDDFIKKVKTKKDIKKLLKLDLRRITKTFTLCNCPKETMTLIKSFIFTHAFMDAQYYSASELNEQQVENLWNDFTDYMSKEIGTNNLADINKDFKNKLIYCVTCHNNAINDMFFDISSRIQLQKSQKEHDAIIGKLNYIADTLSTDTEIQSYNEDIFFFLNQIESLLKSMRIDLLHRRKLQLIYTIGILLNSFAMLFGVTKVMTGDFGSSSYISIIQLIIILAFLIFVFYILMVMLYKIAQNIRCLEDKIDAYTEKLWNIHYEYYEKILKNCNDVIK